METARRRTLQYRSPRILSRSEGNFARIFTGSATQSAKAQYRDVSETGMKLISREAHRAGVGDSHLPEESTRCWVTRVWCVSTESSSSRFSSSTSRRKAKKRFFRLLPMLRPSHSCSGGTPPSLALRSGYSAIARGWSFRWPASSSPPRFAFGSRSIPSPLTAGN